MESREHHGSHRAAASVMIYIVLPAYNEEAGLERLLHRIRFALEGASMRYRVILVNDGSTDRSLDIAQRNRGALPLEVISHEGNKGLGEALKTGFKRVREISRPEDIIITMDSDNSHPPDLIPAIVSKVHDGHNLVVASRYVKGAKEVGLRLHRKVLSRAASALLKTLFPIRDLRDYTCGYRGYSAALIERAFRTYGEMFVRERGFAAIVEILVKLRHLGVRACEVPLLLGYDQKAGASKMPILRTIFRYWSLIVHNLFAAPARPS